MKARQNKPLTVSVGVFDFNVFFIQCSFKELPQKIKGLLNKDQLEQFIEQYDVRNQNEYMGGLTFQFAGGSSLLWFHPSSASRILVHEIVHTVNWGLKNRYIPLTEDTDEVYAYTTEYIFSRILDKQ